MSTGVIIKEALTDEEILACWPVVFELRPHVMHEEYLTRVQQQMRQERFRLFYVQCDSDKSVLAIMGVRVLNFLYSGKTLYIDDLCTLSRAQERGHGGQLLQLAEEMARKDKCTTVSLDSGYTRSKAHRLYLNNGFELGSHHFSKTLNY